MKLITQRGLIKSVAQHWRKVYEPFKKWDEVPMYHVKNGTVTSETKAEIALKLDALDEDTATAEDVDAVIGISGWVDIKCDECGRKQLSVVQVGQEPDYESSTTCICAHCIKDAANLIMSPRNHIRHD